MTDHITHVAFDMHQDSITAAWLVPGAQTPKVRTIPHGRKCSQTGPNSVCDVDPVS